MKAEKSAALGFPLESTGTVDASSFNKVWLCRQTLSACLRQSFSLNAPAGAAIAIEHKTIKAPIKMERFFIMTSKIDLSI